MEHKIKSGEHGSVHYWVNGQGNYCIIFTHGAAMDHGLFQHQIEYFAQKYRVNRILSDFLRKTELESKTPNPKYY